MARAMGVFRASDQSSAIAPNQSVLVLNEDGSAFAQTLYVGPTGGETQVNPLVSDDVGLIVAYVDIPQRALARIVADGTNYDTPFDFEDNPSDVFSAPEGGADGRVLTLASGLPSWVAPSFTITTASANLLANGSMRIAQRDPSGGGAGAVDMTYQVCDRWKTLQNTGTAWSVATGTTGLAGGSPTSFRHISQGNSAKGGKIQILENAETFPLRGQTVSLQAYFYAVAAITDLRMALVSWTGAADVLTDPVSAWNAAGTNPTLAANWAFVNTPANLGIPAATWTRSTLNAQTVPAGCVNLAVMLWCEDITQTGGSDSWDFTMAQLELGSAATTFQMPSLADELARCQRYYYKTFPQGTAPAQNTGVLNGAVAYVVQVAGTGGSYGVMHHYPTTVRSSGAVTFYNPSAANGKWRNVSLPADSGTPSGVASDNGLFIYNPQVVGDAVTNQCYIHLTTDAEL